MVINSLKLINFRNFSKLELNFSPKINVIYGKNASGKTNIVEAINYFALMRSFRTSNDKNLIKENEKDFFIKGIFENNPFDDEIEIYYDGKLKKSTLNKKALTKVGDLIKRVNIIYFIPKEVNFLKESPSIRRNYLNLAISKRYPEYLYNLSKFKKVLKERNDLLKKENIDHVLLEIYTDELIKLSRIIYSYRKMQIKYINDVINTIYQKISGNLKEIKVHYVPFVDDFDNYLSKAKSIFNKALEDDLNKKITTKGINHEDFYLTLKGKNVATFGSQSENRVAVLSLKLSEYFLINQKEKKPIVILDDVLSELDSFKKEKFLEFLKEFSQVFITNTEKIESDDYNNININEFIFN